MLSNDLLNNLVSNINLNEENGSKPDEPYVKIHPELKRMDDDDKNLPTGVCIFYVPFYFNILLIPLLWWNNYVNANVDFLS